MAHIASCIRPDVDTAAVYITQEASSKVSRRTPRLPSRSLPMHRQLPRRSRSLKDLQAASDASLPTRSLSKTPSLANLNQPTTSRYQLWPAAKSPLGQPRPNTSSDKLAALSIARSSTSLSDTAVLPESLPFWQRAGSLSRRRKVSVPELGSTMTTVQEMAVDSRKSRVDGLCDYRSTVPSYYTRKATPP